MIQAIVIDDEKHSRELLRHFLRNSCEGVVVRGEAGDVSAGIRLIQSVRPQLVFLDVEMPGGNGFDILAAFPEPQFEIVFVTGYNAKSIRALNGSALEYLEKPVEIAQLREVLSRIQVPALQSGERLKHLVQTIERDSKSTTHILLPVGNAFQRTALDEILFLEASGGYVVLHLKDGRSCLATRPMKHFEEILPSSRFFRVHKSYIVNCEFVSGFDTGRAGNVVLQDGTQLPIAFRRKSALVRRMSEGS